MLKQPDGSVQVLLQGIARIGLGEVVKTEPHLAVRVQPLVETAEPGLELDALVKNLLGLFQRLVALAPGAPGELTVAAVNIPEPGRLADSSPPTSTSKPPSARSCWRRSTSRSGCARLRVW